MHFYDRVLKNYLPGTGEKKEKEVAGYTSSFFAEDLRSDRTLQGNYFGHELGSLPCESDSLTDWMEHFIHDVCVNDWVLEMFILLWVEYRTEYPLFEGVEGK